MAKGKTNQPLVVWVFGDWLAHPAVVALKAMGHYVYEIVDGAGTQPDLILHPAAHNWTDPMFAEEEKQKDGATVRYYPYLDAALTAARARKRRK